jgi:glucosyl-dolichyl phosphate glucuronosyltransferase
MKKVTRLTVAICTWNRCELLRQSLEEMTKLVVPPDLAWELLVVNNNCTDATDEVIASFAGRLPIRGLHEPTPGLSNARNRAVSEASGDYLVWTDDDVLVDHDWLTAYREAFERLPDGAVFGGPIAPWFPNTPPRWLEQVWHRVAAAYASIDHGAGLVTFDERRLPFGANMAVRTDVQRRFPFDPERGVRPGSRMGGEEIDVVRRAMAAGGGGYWVPAARVRHYIPPDRQTLRYLRRYYYAHGLYVGRYEMPERYPTVLGRPRWLFRTTAMSELRYRLHRPLGSPLVWIEDLMNASFDRGRMDGYRQRAD